MKAQYPNSLRQDKYVIVMTGTYMQKYPEFSKEQIKTYAYEIVGVITYQINCLDSYDAQTSILNSLPTLKNISNLVTNSSTMHCLYIYLGKKDADWMEEVVREDLKARDIPFPEEHKAKYLEFISDITAKVIDDICDTTKAKLIASKTTRKRTVGSKATRVPKKSKSFVEKLSTGSAAVAIKEDEASFGEKEQRKKARVHFADTDLPSK